MCRNIVQPPKRQVNMIIWIYIKEENLIYDQIILITTTNPPTHSDIQNTTIETGVLFFETGIQPVYGTSILSSS